ncbi:MAG: class I SAM-dependent methyltransferase, partial [Chlamydiota bacterium]
MIQNLLFSVGIALCTAFGVHAQEVGHADIGTYYQKEGCAAYSAMRHGTDGALFLDPYFISYLHSLEGQEVLDAGCGSAPWAIYSAKNGAKVLAIDLQEEMLSLAQDAVNQAGVGDRVSLVQGDVARLPALSAFFDLTLSVNVGCNLPSTAQVNGSLIGLGPHIREMARVLKEGGIAVVTAPASLAVVFANGAPHETVHEHISAILQGLPSYPTSKEIVAHLNELKEINRATFAVKSGRLVLIQDESELEPGEEIWRKLPGLTVPNRYHPESEYLQEFADAGLVVKECFHPHFRGRAQWSEY